MQDYESSSVNGRIGHEFLVLLKDKHCKNISVSELVKKCGINRSTFYRHYKDIYDLFDKTCNAVIAETVSVQSVIPPEKSKKYIESLCRAYYGAASKNIEKIGILYKGNGGVRFFHMLRTAWCDDIFNRMKEFDLDSDKILLIHVDKAVIYFVFRLLGPLSDSSEYIFDKYINRFYNTYTIDYSKNLLENLHALDGKAGFSSNLSRAAINFWSKTTEKAVPFSVKELCKSAFISRSLFYTKYSGIYDFVNEIALSGLALLSRFILDCALTDLDKRINAVAFINLGENIANAFRNCLRSDDRTPFVFEVYRSTRRYFFEYIENAKGTAFVEQNRNELEKYIFAVAYNTIETLVSQDEEAFEIRLNSYNELREKLMF